MILDEFFWERLRYAGNTEDSAYYKLRKDISLRDNSKMVVPIGEGMRDQMQYVVEVYGHYVS